MTRIALYDLDKTITQRATFPLFLRHALQNRQSWRLILFPFAGLALLAYAIRLFGRAQLKEALQRIFLGRFLSDRDASTLSRSFAAKMQATNLRPLALEQIAADRGESRLLVLATASYAFYVSDIANMLGFDAVIATDSGRDRSRGIIARINGGNCYGPEKLEKIERWLTAQGLRREAIHVRFYSDHVSDIPTFDWADEPVPVTPDHRLRALALQRSWPIFEW